jgi:hypothetical protein
MEGQIEKGPALPAPFSDGYFFFFLAPAFFFGLPFPPPPVCGLSLDIVILLYLLG